LECSNNPEELFFELSKLIPDSDNYTHNRHILLNFWNKIKPEDLNYKTKRKIELTDYEKNMLDKNEILRAAYYYYNHQLSYGPMFLGWASKTYLKQKTYDNILKRIKNFDIKNLQVKQSSFEESIKNHPNDFLFLDPPYMLNECNDSKMFKGIYPNSNFAIHHNGFDHNLLCSLLKEHKGGFFITYNDCPKIREMYKDYKQIYPSWQYTYGQGETRIGKNRVNTNTNIKESHEIFIIKYP
jgi:DNA adenine methylase